MGLKTMTYNFLTPSRPDQEVTLTTLSLTPETIYPNFKRGYIGLLNARGVLLLNFPNDLGSGMLLNRAKEPLWQGHAGSRDAVSLMRQTLGFALVQRLGVPNPFKELDLSRLDNAIDIQPPREDLEIPLVPAQSSLLAFLAGELGYLVQGGILSVQTPHDPSTCTLERKGFIVWAGDAHSDHALALMGAHEGTVKLTPQPGGNTPLQA